MDNNGLISFPNTQSEPKVGVPGGWTEKAGTPLPAPGAPTPATTDCVFQVAGAARRAALTSSMTNGNSAT